MKVCFLVALARLCLRGHDFFGDDTADFAGLRAQDRDGPMTALIYINTTNQVGDPEHLKVFANADAAEKWFEENDPEGVAFEYDVLERRPPQLAAQWRAAVVEGSVSR